MLSHSKHVSRLKWPGEYIFFFFLPPSPDCRNGGEHRSRKSRWLLANGLLFCCHDKCERVTRKTWENIWLTRSQAQDLGDGWPAFLATLNRRSRGECLYRTNHLRPDTALRAFLNRTCGQSGRTKQGMAIESRYSLDCKQPRICLVVLPRRQTVKFAFRTFVLNSLLMSGRTCATKNTSVA